MPKIKGSLIITGASGFIGRNLLDILKQDFRIYAFARRSQQECNAVVHENIAWIRTDISDPDSLAKAFREVITAGGADYLFHLAAFYDFEGDNNPLYQQTNIDGTRNVLRFARDLNLKRFVFFSSVAACDFPKPGEALNEDTPPDGDHTYAWSKRVCEEMLKEQADAIPSCIIRLGAVFSDWCEYPPLYVFLNTWLGKSLKKSILGGKGESAIPYIHVRDIARFLRHLIQYHERLQSAQVVIASTSGSTSHKELFTAVTRCYSGNAKKPILIPRLISGLGLYLMYFWGKLTGNLPFERPWMYRYIDLKLNVENRTTEKILKWRADPRLQIENRLLYLIERMKSEPHAWHLRNLAALQRNQDRPDLHFYMVLTGMENEIINALLRQLTIAKADSTPLFQESDSADLIWLCRLFFRLLVTSLHTGNRMLLVNYFEMTAINRLREGYTAPKIISLLQLLNQTVLQYLSEVDDLVRYSDKFYDLLTMPIEFAIDEIEYQDSLSLQETSTDADLEEAQPTPESRNARAELEETIWKCLVHRNT